MQLHRIIEVIAPTVFDSIERRHYVLGAIERSDIEQIYRATIVDYRYRTVSTVSWSYNEDTAGTERQRIAFATEMLKHGSQALDNAQFRNPAPVPVRPCVDDTYEVQDVDFSE